jgi:transposase
MIEKLAAHTRGHKAVVVLDAGIATDENLKLITQKRYKYLCVSRTKIKDYQLIPGRLTVLMNTKSKQTIRLKSVTATKSTDYYLEVKSQTKALEETAMKNQFEKRFEAELQKIHTAIHRKGALKN